MNYLETILEFLTRLARIIFRSKPKPSTGDCPCPCPCPESGNNPALDAGSNPVPDPLPAPVEPPLPSDAGNGSDPDLHRSDTLALAQDFPHTDHSHPGADWLGMSGYSLMMMGGAGCLYKWIVG